MLAGWAATAVQPEMFKYSLDSLSWNFVHKLCNFGIPGNVVAWMNELHVLLSAYILMLQIGCKSSHWYHQILMVSQPSYLYASHGQQEQDDAWDLQATTEVHVGDLGWHEACECRLYPICCSQIWSGPTIHTQRAPRDLNTKFGKGTKSSPNLTNSAVEGTGSVAIYGFDCRVEPGSEYQAKIVLAVLFSLLYISVFVLFLLFMWWQTCRDTLFFLSVPHSTSHHFSIPGEHNTFCKKDFFYYSLAQLKDRREDCDNISYLLTWVLIWKLYTDLCSIIIIFTGQT